VAACRYALEGGERFVLNYDCGRSRARAKGPQTMVEPSTLAVLVAVSVTAFGGAAILTVFRWRYGPLLQAVRQGDAQKVRALLDAGADVNARDRRAETPLHHAALLSRLEVARVLVEGGADVRACSPDGTTPLHYAAADANGTAVLELLLERGADVNAANRDGRTPLHWAVRRCSAETVAVLLAHRAHVNARDGEGRTPLHRLAMTGMGDSDVATAEILLENGAGVNAQDDGGRTPLHHALRTRREKLAGLLGERGGRESGRE